MYDWSEGGDTEVVVEDIERLNMDYWDKYDIQQKDWRMFTEVQYLLKYPFITSNQWIIDIFHLIIYLRFSFNSFLDLELFGPDLNIYLPLKKTSSGLDFFPQFQAYFFLCIKF